ncbi:MAG: hypothetical protein WBA74_10285 [Cyclobacteriaceae bacterium]
MDKNINIDEIRQTAADNHLIQESGGQTYCPVCMGDIEHFIDPINDKVSWIHPTQKAHFLSNDKPNMKKYGKIVIEDNLNHTLVCSLKCNNIVQIRNNLVEKQKIIIDVLFKYMANNPTSKQEKQLYDAWCYLDKFIIEDKKYMERYSLLCEYFIVYERSLK